MKRTNNYLALVAILLLIIAAIALWGCSKSESANANYTPEDFLSLDNFTLRTNVKPDSVIRYDKSGSDLRYSTTHVGDGYTNTVYYVFGKSENKEYSEGVWKDIEDTDVDSYVNSIENACGLVYNKLDATEFTEIEGKKLKFSVEPERFFKQAYRQIYQNYFGNDYDEETFAKDFEQNSEALFGNLDDYEVTLDCSASDSISLTIENKAEKSSDVYEYYAIGSTEIELPE